MQNLNREQYTTAMEGWVYAKTDLRSLEELFPANHIFNISTEQVDWLRKTNANKEFCAEVGVVEGRLSIMLSALDEKGNRIAVGEVPYSVFEPLKEDITLTETQTYSVVKKVVLSKDMRKIDNDSDMYYPIANKPIMEQDKAVDSIESWQNNGQDWFYAEYKQNGGKGIFNKFYVPADKICHGDQQFSFVCSFGLKYSEIYQKQLPALIFIGVHNNLGGSVETISNTYDYAKPCPPICKIPDFGIDE
ncbi:hypothetical protein [Chryseobacterium indoltheticum]|jgi:hypothetical protein|uniref:hypothetical protein n=1 Tax=Chryseobacterium indoltheticum TaxID=254 RepID=UPI001912A6AB|nr:hypothetical protein [Chryseobacterium indoltheticum]QQQ27815.1 hypothetical protein JJL46_17280 [Chryseobacterium indoltheticum]